MKTFPHMGNSGFPGTQNVNVYSYENNFDYTRWQPNVKLKLCNVPWCSSYENVPGFETDDERDAWFASVDGCTVELASETHLLPDGSIKLPLPFNVLSMYNYIAVEFPPPTSADDPIAYQKQPSRLKWFFFITDIRSIAGSTTKAVLQQDDWTTFYNDCKISYLMLERGHYPVAQVDASQYLANPLENNRFVSAPDVNYGTARNVASADTIVWNAGQMWACIATNANAQGSWGTFANGDVPSGATAKTPASPMPTIQGVPSASVFAVPASELSELLANIEAAVPQFKQAVRGVFFVSEKLLNLGTSFTFCNVTCRVVSATQKNFELLKLNESAFGFESRYAKLAKLYTSPYSHIEITNENGIVANVRVEDTTGTIDAMASLNLAWPSISLDCVLTGINGDAASVTFQTIDERRFVFGGDWYKTVSRWSVPVFAVTLDGATAYDVASEYSRTQQGSAASTAYSNALRSSAVTTNNTALQIAANVAMTETSNAAAAKDTTYSNALNQALQFHYQSD